MKVVTRTYQLCILCEALSSPDTVQTPCPFSSSISLTGPWFNHPWLDGVDLWGAGVLVEKGGDQKGQWRQVPPRSHLCKPPSLTDTAGVALPGGDTTLPPPRGEGQLRSSACQAGAPGTSLGAPSPRGIAPGAHLPGILCVCPAPYIFIYCSQREKPRVPAREGDGRPLQPIVSWGRGAAAA